MACVEVFITYLPVTAVAISLPAIQAGLGASTSDLSWPSDALVLPMAALILTLGVFGDVHGRKCRRSCSLRLHTGKPDLVREVVRSPANCF
jgi:MFS family permease